MFVKKWDHTARVTVMGFKGLKKWENFWLPDLFKYLAWFIVLASVVSSSTILIMYGMAFGPVKTYLWLTAFLISFMLMLVITLPLKIFFFILLNSFCLKKKPVIAKRKIDPCLLSNPDDLVKRERLLRFRQCNVNLYNPTPLHKLQSRLDNIKYHLELRNLVVAGVFYSFFLLTGAYIIQIDKSPFTFMTNKIMLENILNGSYTNSIKFNQIKSYKTFMEYLNNTLLPMLLVSHLDSASNDSSGETSNRKRRSWDNTWEYTQRPLDNLRKRQILDDFGNLDKKEKKDVFQKGWTMNSNVKLLGKPRFRQVRVKNGSCKHTIHIPPVNLECADELNLFNVERGNFSLHWRRSPPKGLTEAQVSPWIYRSAWDTATLPIFAKFSLYPGGGYILDLARNIDDARIILDFVDAFNWVDTKTRVIFIDFTLYCVNTNLFTIVTLVVEKPASEYFLLSHKIHTCKFLFLTKEFEVTAIIISILFFVLMLLFLLRESLKIHRTSLKLYIRRAFSVVDLTLIFCGVLSLLCIILRSLYVSDLLRKLEKSNNNDFVSFIYADFLITWSIWLESVMVCLAAFKVLRLMRFKVAFYQAQNILTHCFRRFVDLTLHFLILYIAFALFFNLTLGSFSERFRNFGISLSTLIGETVTVDGTFDVNILSNNSFISSIFFIFFVFFIYIVFSNTFIAVIHWYLHNIRTVRFTDKYNILEFLRYMLTSRRQNDILHLKGDKAFSKKLEESLVLRLKGGGNKLTREKKKKNEKRKWKKKCEKWKTEDMEEKRKPYLKDFVRKRLYDGTKYVNLDSDRAAALKNLMILFLTEDEEVRQVFCENSLQALFYSYTTDGTGRSYLKKEPGDYFLVTEKSQIKVFDKNIFERMKKVVEDLAVEKGLVTAEEESAEEMIGCENLMDVLEEKLNLLDQKLRSRLIGSSLERG